MNPDNQEPMRQTQPPPAEVNALIALYKAQRFAEVESKASRLIEQYSDAALLWKLLGAALQMQGKDALPAFRRVAELMPDDAEAHNNLGVELQGHGQLENALASYRSALLIDPGFVEAHYNLGNVLWELGQLEDAVASYNNGLRVKPDSALILSNLGATLQELGRLDDALASCRRALELEPDLALVHSNLLGILNCSPGFTPSYCLAEARKYGRKVSVKVTAKFDSWQCPDNPERLRVGMVSGDLHNHPVGYFLESLLQNLDPTRVELIAYPIDAHLDALTTRIKPRFAAWKSLYNLSDEAAARLIHSDGVHVLLDLSGHTANNRLPIFAWKPAPVQTSWLGDFATTGLPQMDYLLADETGVPEAHRGDFSESVWYLPDTRLCFTPPEIDLPVENLPALQNGFITFGSFQRLTKVGDEVLTTWGKVLDALPNSRLRWQCKQLGDPAVVTELVGRLQRHGIDSSRVTMHGGLSREDYLAAHAEVDVILDTFPFPGGTTTCEALWMGVPTLTLAGATLLSRQGASMLAAAGLKEWIANDEEEYIAKAVALSGDLPRLATLRAGLREQVETSPLFDAPRFARNFEDALWGMWQARSKKYPSATAA